MNIDDGILSEIEDQLTDDILDFGWLSQIVRLQHPQYTEDECTGTVLDSVSHLHKSGTIIVGSAREADGMVLIDPWPGSGRELRSRMKTAIADAAERDRDYCFWIQLAEHVQRESE